MGRTPTGSIYGIPSGGLVMTPPNQLLIREAMVSSRRR